MIEKGTLLYIYAETPLHPGSGSELGTIDLPIQREKHTGFPMIQGSGLKGVLREAAEAKDGTKDYVKWVFGPEQAADHAGALSVGDARILLFPVRSLKGIFAWITCPMVLNRLKRDLATVGIKADGAWQGFPTPEAENKCCVQTTQSAVAIDSRNVVLEEYTFEAQPDKSADELGKWLAATVLPQTPEYKFWQDKLKNSLVVLPDDAFTDFVKYHTMVISRTKIDDTKKTVIPGALWTEEHLPPETILYSPLFGSKARYDGNGTKPPGDLNTGEGVIKWLAGLNFAYVRLGGDETVGRGLARVTFHKEEKK